MSLAQVLLPEFDHEMAGCRKVLERIPEDKFDYKPHAKSFSLGQLANHLATVPGWLVSTLTLTELDFSLPETRASLPAPATDRKGLLKTFEEGLAKGRTLLAGAQDADLQVVWSGKSEGKVVFAMPRIAVYRGFILNHAIHHRAQLGVYLRLLDVPVPALYGPSADDMGA